MLALVPPVVIFLAKNPLVAKFDLSSVIATASGAAPLSKDVELEACKILGISEIYQGTQNRFIHFMSVYFYRCR